MWVGVLPTDSPSVIQTDIRPYHLIDQPWLGTLRDVFGHIGMFWYSKRCFEGVLGCFGTFSVRFGMFTDSLFCFGTPWCSFGNIFQIFFTIFFWTQVDMSGCFGMFWYLLGHLRTFQDVLGYFGNFWMFQDILAKSQKQPKVTKIVTKKIAKRTSKQPKVAKGNQKQPEQPTILEISQKQPNFTIYSQKQPTVAKSNQKQPKVAKSSHKQPKASKSTQKQPKVA